MLDLTGKIAIVTGGASGIGRETVLKLASKGALIFSGDVDTIGNKETAKIANDKNGIVHALELDITNNDSIESFASSVMDQKLGGRKPVDIIVNVAGWDKIQPFLDATPDFMDKVLSINLAGPINIIRYFLPEMIAVNQGKIVNISSDAGRVGSMGETIYSGAKGGIIAFTKSLARETARHSINVNCVCPGPTNTPLLMSQPQSMREKLAKAIPFKRIGEPEEVAEAVLFFVSGMSNYITGQVLSVSGGLTMAD
ncbi:MAG: SDR family oxidoreductase [Alphaproteobacteria bacterium]|nr:SDR family oxidoreductase [Alphaproteobacteria bacterium]